VFSWAFRLGSIDKIFDPFNKYWLHVQNVASA